VTREERLLRGDPKATYRLGGLLWPQGLHGLLVKVVPEGPGPVLDNLITVRFLEPAVAKAATDGKYGGHEIRVPASCLTNPSTH
jgi:hypothetical protein